MIKCIVIIFFVINSLEVIAFPSVNIERSKASKSPTGEELKRLIQETISQTLNDRLLTSTTTPAPDPIAKEIATVALPPWQQVAAQNLTETFEELIKSVRDLKPPSTTPAPASASPFKPLVTAEEQLTVSATHTPPLCGYVFGYKYSPNMKHCYKLHSEEMNWVDADAACGAEKAYLAVINSHEEARSLINIINENPSENFFVGVYKNSASEWVTVTGETVEEAAGYNVWSASEPFEGGTWRFASFYTSNNGSLISRTEVNSFPFICEKAP